MSGVEIDNATSGIYQFETDSGIDRNTNFGPSAGLVVNSGLIEKTAGTGTSAIIVNFNNQGGTVAAQTGTLSPAGGGTDTGGVFNASAGATVDLCDGSQTTSLSGTYTGTGSGTVNIGSGTVAIGASGATFDFAPGLFQWSSGGLALEGNTLTNTGTIAIDATTDVPISNTVPNGQGGTLVNQGTILQTNAGAPSLVSGVEIDNATSGIYQFETDSGIDRNTNFGPSAGLVVNSGLIEKTGGTGTSAIIVNFDNQGGTVAAQSGLLSLAGGGTNTGGDYEPGAGATIDLSDGTGINPPIATFTGTYTGSGAGTVNIGAGTINLGQAGATFDFPPGLFEWSSGSIQTSGNTLTNTGSITIDAANDVSIFNGLPSGEGGTLLNEGTIVQTSTGAPSLVDGVEIDNAASGVYQFETDSGIDRNTNFGPMRGPGC